MTPEEELKAQFEDLKKNPKKIVKGAAKIVTTYCVSAVAVTIVHNLVPKDVLNRNRKVQLYVAAWAMGGVIGDRAGEWAANESGTVSLACTLVDHFKKSKDEEPETPKETQEAPTE